MVFGLILGVVATWLAAVAIPVGIFYPLYKMQQHGVFDHHHHHRDVRERHAMFLLNSTGGFKEIPKFSVHGDVDVANASAEFRMEDGKVLLGKLTGFPEVDTHGIMKGGFHLDIPGSKEPLSGTWITVESGMKKSDEEALGKVVELVAKEKAKRPDMTEDEIRALIDAHMKVFE